MGKKSTHVKTYELRQNDLCIMLKQLDPASNKNYGKILHKLRQFVRICICCKRLQRNYRGKRVKCRINHGKQTHKFGNAKNVRKRTSFAHSCIICNGKKYSMLKIFAMAKYVRKMEWKLLHIKHILYMRPFGALKIAPQSVGNKNGTKAVLQGWAAAFVPYMLSFTY